MEVASTTTSSLVTGAERGRFQICLRGVTAQGVASTDLLVNHRRQQCRITSAIGDRAVHPRVDLPRVLLRSWIPVSSVVARDSGIKMAVPKGPPIQMMSGRRAASSSQVHHLRRERLVVGLAVCEVVAATWVLLGSPLLPQKKTPGDDLVRYLAIVHLVRSLSTPSYILKLIQSRLKQTARYLQPPK